VDAGFADSGIEVYVDIDGVGNRRQKIRSQRSEVRGRERSRKQESGVRRES